MDFIGTISLLRFPCQLTWSPLLWPISRKLKLTSVMRPGSSTFTHALRLATRPSEFIPPFINSIELHLPMISLYSCVFIRRRYAREIGPKIQAFFEDYFQIPFPLPKQDMIAIPDFAAGLFPFFLFKFENVFLSF